MAGRRPQPRIEISPIAGSRGFVHVVAVDGSLELPTVASFRTALAGLAEAGARRVLVDLTLVDFIDVSGIATLYRAGVAAEAFAIAVTPGSQPARTLALCQLDGMVPAFDRRAEAVAALG